MESVSNLSANESDQLTVGGKEILLSSLIGDALALGPHWVYNQDEIRRKLGDIEGYHDPISRYHVSKSAGDQSHYGDQVMVLVRSMKDEGFDLERFAEDWRAFWEDPSTQSYMDGATRNTLQHLQNEGSPTSPGSSSNDIAGAARIAPLFLDATLSESEVIETARNQTAFSHGDPAVAETAELFVRWVFAIRGGASIPEGLQTALSQIDPSVLPAEWMAAAEASVNSDRDDRQAVEAHGLSCHIPDAFPAVVHLLLRHPQDPVAAMKANVHAGGDSAARGLLLGLIYGAALGLKAFPSEWVERLEVGEEVMNLNV